MNRELTEAIIQASYVLMDIEPTDRLDFLAKALDVKQVILRCMMFLDDLKGSPYLGGYTEDDLETIHEAFCDSAMPLVQMIEHFLEKAVLEGDDNPFVV